jgi:hypothetical protein
MPLIRRDEARFIADNAEDGTPLVLDQAHHPMRVVLGCHSDDQAERVARLLNVEAGWGVRA